MSKIETVRAMEIHRMLDLLHSNEIIHEDTFLEIESVISNQIFDNEEVSSRYPDAPGDYDNIEDYLLYDHDRTFRDEMTDETYPDDLRGEWNQSMCVTIRNFLTDPNYNPEYDI